MNGFYLSIERNQTGQIDLIHLGYEEFLKVSVPDKNALYIFSDNKSQFVTVGLYNLFNLGTLVYKNTWHKRALKLIGQDLTKGLTVREIASETRGQFCLVVHRQNEVCVVTDRMATFPNYLFRGNNRTCVSNMFFLMAKNCDTTLNHQGIAEYLNFNYSLSATLFNEINQLDMGTIYFFGMTVKAEVYDNYLDNLQFGRFQNVEAIAAEVKETISNNLAFLDIDDKVFADITGGLDTRTLVAFLKHANITFAGGICGEQVLREAEIAVRVAENLGVSYYPNIKINNRDLFQEVLEKHFIISNGIPVPYHSTELINYYEEINKNYDLHMGGFAGSQLWGNFLPPLSYLNSNLTSQALSRKYYPYNDIFKNSILTRKAYYSQIREKIDSLLRKLGTTRHEDASAFFSTSTFSKHYHGSLLATHNTIMPIYVPYLEANFARLMLETPYDVKRGCGIQRFLITELNHDISKLMSSRGFTAQYSKTLNNYRRERITEAIRGFMFDSVVMIKLAKFFTRQKTTASFATLQRAFWVEQIKTHWTDNMAVFQFLDRAKLIRYLQTEPRKELIMAKILYINRLLEELGSNIR